MTNYPTSKDTIKNDWANNTPVKDDHPNEHNLVADAVEALQTKVGIDGDTNEDSFDFKLLNIASGEKAISTTDLNNHISDTSTHGVSGNIVGTTDTQTLSNKTLTSPTITDKTSTGNDTGTETLQNKTITNANNDVNAKGLHSNTTIVRVVGATAPTVGQVLTAIDNTSANWQSVPPSSFNGAVIIQTSGGSTSPIPFDTELVDTNNYWTSGSATTLTITDTGYYRVEVTINSRINSTNNQWGIVIRKNGTTEIARSTTAYGNTVGFDAGHNISNIFSLISGDYIELLTVQTAGTVTLGTIGNTFSIQRIQ